MRRLHSTQSRANAAVSEVEIHGVTKRFGASVAVNNVSLTIRTGEFLTLLGPSGCGKTTLLRMIAGFELPTEGKILLGGNEITTLPPYERPVHTVFQQYALFPHLTVARNVAFGLEQKGMARAEIARKVAEALELVQLGGFADRLPKQMSGGQQQRVAIARALVCEPRVLLLDEPLGALDLKLRRAMQVELRELNQRLGISFIFVTHDQEEALTMSDRIAVMRAGRIEQLGTPREVYERPRTEFVAGFIGTSNILRGEARATDGGFARVGIGGATVRVPVEEPVASGTTLTFAVRPEKIALSTNGNGELAGTIREQIYLGDTTHWRVELADGQTVTVFEQNGADREHRLVGQTVSLGWSPENAVPLAEP